MKIMLIIVAHIHNSGNYKRAWHYIYTDIGCVVLCDWYRSYFPSHDNFTSFVAKIEQYSREKNVSLIAGEIKINRRK